MRRITRIDVLVIILISAVMVGLSLPLILSSRETSRRKQCESNLKDIGVAVQVYLVQQQYFPPLYSSSPIGKDLKYPLSWATYVLPMINHQLLYNSINFSYGAGDPPNHTTILQSRVTSLVCPAEDLQGVLLPGWTNYVANYGGPSSIRTYSGAFVPNSPSNIFSPGGPLNQNLGPLALHSFTDGIGVTSLFSEKLIGVPRYVDVHATSEYDKRVVFSVSVPSTHPDTNDQLEVSVITQACQHISSDKISPSYHNPASGAIWSGTYWRYLWVNAYNHGMPPNGRSCFPNFEAGPVAFNTATSNHLGGVNMCFCDGSVRFVKDTININTWRAFGTRNGNDTLDSSKSEF